MHNENKLLKEKLSEYENDNTNFANKIKYFEELSNKLNTENEILKNNNSNIYYQIMIRLT